jgi:TM2 domain-containing membrane protein YozV
MFCPKCGKETSENQAFCASCGAPLSEAAPRGTAVLAAGISPKSRLATTLLAWFLGYFGAHRFYIGKTGTAVVMLILGIVGWATIWIFGLGLVFIIPVCIWALVDFIFAVVGKMPDKDGLLIEKW